MTVGGLLLVFITFWSSRQAQLHTGGSSSNCEPVNTHEQHVNEVCSNEGSSCQLGPIHHFEVWIPSEPSGPEIVPPSYEEAISSDNTASLQGNSVMVCDEQEQNHSDKMRPEPPSYEESRVNTPDVYSKHRNIPFVFQTFSVILFGIMQFHKSRRLSLVRARLHHFSLLWCPQICYDQANQKH